MGLTTEPTEKPTKRNSNKKRHEIKELERWPLLLGT